ncbi:MAG: FMN-binding protein [bacterium]|nr:FMN-binding protein [bacterium]
MKKALIVLLVIVLPVVFLSASADPIDKAPDMKRILEKVERYIERNPPAAVKAVFNFFSDLIGAPQSAKDCKDGTYKGESIYDDYKYKHVISLKIKGGKILEVNYDEVKKDGNGKRDNKKYCAEMKKGSGASPADVYPVYEKQLVKHQDPGKVDAVSGATYSLYRFKSAAVRALMKARSDNRK